MRYLYFILTYFNIKYKICILFIFKKLCNLQYAIIKKPMRFLYIESSYYSVQKYWSIITKKFIVYNFYKFIVYFKP